MNYIVLDLAIPSVAVNLGNAGFEPLDVESVAFLPGEQRVNRVLRIFRIVLDIDLIDLWYRGRSARSARFKSGKFDGGQSQ